MEIVCFCLWAETWVCVIPNGYLFLIFVNINIAGTVSSRSLVQFFYIFWFAHGPFSLKIDFFLQCFGSVCIRCIVDSRLRSLKNLAKNHRKNIILQKLDNFLPLSYIRALWNYRFIDNRFFHETDPDQNETDPRMTKRLNGKKA